MADLKPAYLIHGDDDVRLDAWRGRLRGRVGQEGSDSVLEVLDADAFTADALIAATQAMTLGVGRRYVLADGVQKLKDAEVKRVGQALRDLAPDTVVVLIAAGKVSKGRGPAPAKLIEAVEKAEGEVHLCALPGTSAYPAWTAQRFAEAGVEISREAAALLIERAPRDEREQIRQRGLMREIEKLSVYAGEEGRLEPEDIDAISSSDLQTRAIELAGAIAAGEGGRAQRIVEQLRIKGEDQMPILFTLNRKLREIRAAWALANEGASLQEVQTALGAPPWIAKRALAEGRAADGEQLERAIAELADWDYAIRGGSHLDGWTALTLAIERVTAVSARG